MGCGCGGGRKTSMNISRTTKAGINETPKVHSSAVCFEKYDELSELDRKIIALHHKFRLVANKGKRYADIQRIIRSWIRDLRHRCPDEDSLTEYKDYILSEYDKHCK